MKKLNLSCNNNKKKNNRKDVDDDDDNWDVQSNNQRYSAKPRRASTVMKLHLKCQ